MADKKIFFFKVKLLTKDENNEIDYTILPNAINNILDNHQKAKTVGNVKVLDITSKTDELHTTLDVYRYQQDHLFLRAARQKPNFSTIIREYQTGIFSPVLPGIKETEKGIENYTYIYIDYTYGILSVVKALGAPDENAIVTAFAKYSDEYTILLEPIPNPEGIKRIYNKNNTCINKINVCIPRADPVILENVLGVKGKHLLEEVSKDTINISINISSNTKKGKITNNSEDSESLVDCLLDNLSHFSLASVNAKYDGEKSKTYNLYDELFYFPFTIKTTHKIDGQNVYYTTDEMATLFHEGLKIAFNQSRDFIIQIANRSKKE